MNNQGFGLFVAGILIAAVTAITVIGAALAWVAQFIVDHSTI